MSIKIINTENNKEIVLSDNDLDLIYEGLRNLMDYDDYADQVIDLEQKIYELN
jgi:methyl coenzyme M reductase subunit C-like uncharacterized protein (methanogenesis marker protein 7)